ncbi:hypothetical protein ACIO6T_30715 [Streptomyces sp. NPDC087532]|uniref:hypothetical protein n=1 Tax=Streptomyces sp. NPDC087532 TaxID=3365795 RepID=UPI003813FB83
MDLFTQSALGGGDGGARQERWLQQAAGDAAFDQAEFVDRYAVLRWDTGQGGIALVHSMTDGNASPKAVVRALRLHHGERLSHRYACVVAAQTSTQVTHPYVPELKAYDIDRADDPYETTWAQLAAVLGQRPLYWFHSLRDRDAIAAWRPGTPPTLVPAHDIATPVTALTELAADEPDGSPAAELCWYLAREIRYRGYTSTTRYIDELRKNAAEGGDGAHLVLGAVPAPLTRPAPQEPTETVRRAGWLSITERRDVLAHRVADFARHWNGGRDWHTGAVTSVRPAACDTAREWSKRLVPAPEQPPTVLENVLLDNGPKADADVLLHDPVAAVLVPHQAPGARNNELHTYTLQRLPTHSPLAALILSAGICWIRTQDGALWLAPERNDWGIGFGCSGNGCHTLARLVDVLLDDITAPAVRSGDPAAPHTLFELLRHTPSGGTTTYTRAQLLAARAG